MPPLNRSQRIAKLKRHTADNRKELLKVLLKGRDRVERRILAAAADKRFATVRRIRDGIYKDLSAEYLRLQGDLDEWTKGSILRTSKEYHALAAEDLLATGEDAKVVAFTKFSAAHTQEYFERVHPFNAERLAAVNVHMNPQLTRMLESDVRALRGAVVDVLREAQVAGMTSSERWRLLRSTVLDYADNPASWKFIDRAGRKWKGGNYFNMLNRTVTANIARDSYHDTLTDEGRDLVEIIGGVSAESHPACREWNGRIVSVTGQTEGFPALSEYVEAGGFHPNCVHSTAYISEHIPAHAKRIEEQRQGGTATTEPAESPTFTPAKSKQEALSRLGEMFDAVEVDMPLDRLNSALQGLEASMGAHNLRARRLAWNPRKGMSYGRATKNADDSVDVFIRKSFAQNPNKYAQRDNERWAIKRKENIARAERGIERMKSGRIKWADELGGRDAELARQAKKLERMKATEHWSTVGRADDPMFAAMAHEGWHVVDFSSGAGAKGMTVLQEKFSRALGAANAHGTAVTEYATVSLQEKLAEVGAHIAAGIPIDKKIKAAFTAAVGG